MGRNFSQRIRFSSSATRSGSESGVTKYASVLHGDAGGATQKADLGQFSWYGITAPKMASPRKFCRGVLVMRPKKRTSANLFCPEWLSGKWFASANLAGNVGGETPKPDTSHVDLSGKNRTVAGWSPTENLRWSQISI